MGPTLGNYWKFPNYVELGSNASKLWQGKAGEQFGFIRTALVQSETIFLLDVRHREKIYRESDRLIHYRRFVSYPVHKQSLSIVVQRSAGQNDRILSSCLICRTFLS